MKVYIKVTIAFFVLFFGVVAIMESLSDRNNKQKFELLDNVQESDIAYRTSALKVLDELIKYNSNIEKSIANNIALNELKSQILQSGLNLDEVYFTHSFINGGMTSLYVEINDVVLFKSAFEKFLSNFNLAQHEGYSTFYISQNEKISIKKHPEYVKINFGSDAKNELNKEKVKPSSFFKQLLEKSDRGVINTTGTSNVDSTDYATFSYSFDKEISLIIDWKVDKNHPLKRNKTANLKLYPTQKDNLRFFTNLDTYHLQKQLNPYLKETGTARFDKLPSAAREILKLWNGKSSLQFGGKTAQKTTQFITEFDDDFNQIEKKIVKVDSIPNLGLYWGTKKPQETLILFDKLPNVKFENNKLQIAFLPSLITKSNEKDIEASTKQIDFEKEKFKPLLYLNINTKGIEGELKIEKTSAKNARLQLTMKDWKGLSDPKSIKISSFW